MEANSWEDGGLGDLSQFMPATAKARMAPVELHPKTGHELLQMDETIRIAGTGESGTGKSFVIFSMLEHRVENLAGDDDWIRKMFGHIPELCAQVLTWDLPERRKILAEAHKVEIVDFDNKGMKDLFASYQCNPILYDCITYEGVQNWEQAIQASTVALERLKQHNDDGWSKLGCWMMFDNVGEAWDEAQSDYTENSYGLTHIELRNAIARKHPGKDSDAMSLQGEESGNRMNWVAIKGQHKQWIRPMLSSGFNLYLTAPPKQRDQKVKNMLTGATEIVKMHSVGGAKEIVYYMDWVLHRYTTPDKALRFARFDKCRFTGLIPLEIMNPDWEHIEMEMNRLCAMQINMQKEKFAKRLHASSLPIDLSQYVKMREKPKRIKIEIQAREVPKIPMPIPSVPSPITSAAGLGLANINPSTLAVPLPSEVIALPNTPGSWVEEKELPKILVPVPTSVPLPDPPVATAIPSPIPGPAVVPPPIVMPEKPAVPAITILQKIVLVGEVNIEELNEQFPELSEHAFDLVISDLLEAGYLYEPSLGILKSTPQGIDSVARNAPAQIPPPSIPAPIPTPATISPSEPSEKEEETQTEGVSDESDNEEKLDPYYVIGKFDRGKGKYHRPTCKRVKNMSHITGTRDPETREACKNCKPGALGPEEDGYIMENEPLADSESKVLVNPDGTVEHAPDPFQTSLVPDPDDSGGAGRAQFDANDDLEEDW